MINARDFLQLCFVFSVVFIIIFLIAAKQEKEYVTPEESVCGKYSGNLLSVSREQLYKFENDNVKFKIDKFKVVLTCEETT